MSDSTYDVVILGAGPAGYAAALYGGSAGLSIAIVEQDRVGGTCLQRGCVPAKEFLETATVRRTIEAAGAFGIGATYTGLDFATAQARKQDVVAKLTGGLTGLMRSRGNTIVEGRGVYRGGGVIEVGGERLVGETVILAPGSVPRTIPGFDVDGEVVLTSDEVLSLTKLPDSVVIIGGGVIGCEFASMMADLGTKVTVVEALPQVLPGVDPDLVGILLRSFRRRGVTVRTGVGVSGLDRTGSGAVVRLADGTQVEAEQVVVAVGRRPNTDGVIDPASGVGLDERGFIKVDDQYRTSEAGVYAIGDAIATPQLAHVGFAEGVAVVKSILGEISPSVEYDKVPWCIYTHPEIAFAGLTEEQARAQGRDVIVKKDPLGGNSRARILGETDGMVKVVADRATHQLLGVHIVGPWATELLSPGYLAVNWEASAEEVAAFLQPHPTLSEAFGETVLALTGRSLHVG
ncbi:dihydrolipoamide dehydrogenase [Acidimicrobium ferrooxidans DSM 10331]|uniref:Dihydrolipoyl dehydrogenase n=1 Tax=Acidimicrobium ferrooxidans (strain DSM 10331 / JCM 15462 / NBRC 103882 / ICP) TaxID=525909 RepID=C7LY59_ACIFD|nr:dihydrolipoyl dehydrogenase [Acidimicrobium ferrooxidans]ACU53667.1 dihydrolipoamide dehydrogenase [Acidimicrobium ferrooxidans DSM 10331]